jgi:hypothetical protein
MTGLINGQYDKATARELYGESCLGFMGVDVTMNGHDPRRRGLASDFVWYEEACVLCDSIWTGETDVLDPDATAIRLYDGRQQPTA